MAYTYKRDGVYYHIVMRYFENNIHGTLSDIQNWIADCPVFLEGSNRPRTKRNRRMIPTRRFIRSAALRGGCPIVRIKARGIYKGARQDQGVTVIFRPGTTESQILRAVDKIHIQGMWNNRPSCKDRVSFSLSKGGSKLGEHS